MLRRILRGRPNCCSACEEFGLLKHILLYIRENVPNMIVNMDVHFKILELRPTYLATSRCNDNVIKNIQHFAGGNETLPISFRELSYNSFKKYIKKFTIKNVITKLNFEFWSSARA